MTSLTRYGYKTQPVGAYQRLVPEMNAGEVLDKLTEHLARFGGARADSLLLIEARWKDGQHVFVWKARSAQDQQVEAVMTETYRNPIMLAHGQHRNTFWSSFRPGVKSWDVRLEVAMGWLFKRRV